MNVFKLSINMRVMSRQLAAQQGDQQDAQQLQEAQRLQSLADYLLSVGEGRVGNSMRVPDHMLLPADDAPQSTLIQTVFGDLSTLDPNRRNEVLISHAILTPKNGDVDDTNNTCMQLLPGEAVSYLSADHIDESDQNAHVYPPEFLNTLQHSGLPSHNLQPKVGVPVVLLRNMSHTVGLANGTRLRVVRLSDRFVQAEIASGTNVGQNVLIPRIALQPSDPQLPIMFTRRQFPLRPAFALTINKAQGQTLQKVGIYLPRPVFSHGQMYVAMSRVGDPDGVKVMVTEGGRSQQGQQDGVFTNKVYDEVFRM